MAGQQVRAPVILIEATPFRPADAVGETVRLAGGGGECPYFYGGQHYLAGTIALPTIATALGFDEGELGSGGFPSAATIEWAPADHSDLAAMAGYFWTDAPITVRIGEENPEGALPPVVLAGRVMAAPSADGRLKLTLADPATEVKKPLPVGRFAGTGGLEGPAEWEGVVRQRVWGRVWNLAGSPIDKANNIHCFADPLRPILEFSALRDRGASVEIHSVLGWQGSAAATFAALQAAAVPDGKAIACPSIACVKHWTEPAGDFTADINGEVGAGYVETSAEIAARLVAELAGPAFAPGTIAAAVAARPAPVGWVVSDDTETVNTMLDALLGNVSLLWVLSPTGQIVIRQWAWGESAGVVRSIDVTRKSTVRPLAIRKLGFRRNETPIARSSLAAIVLASDATYLDGTPIEDLKPAEGGANVTGSHTAAAIAGQGTFATLNSAAYGSPQLTGFGALAPLSDVYFGSPFLLEGAGGAQASLNAFKTAMGISSGISGQGPGATAPGHSVLNAYVDGGVLHVKRPVGGSYQAGNGAAGAILIRLPGTIETRHAMVRFYIDAYEYASGQMQTYEVGGYVYPPYPAWINCSARMIGGSGAARAVRFGRDGDKWVVQLGEMGGAWSYPAITVRDLQVSYLDQNPALWETGWSIYQVTGPISYVDVIVSNPNAGDAVFGVNMLEGWGGSLALLNNFKTALGISAGFDGQGALATLNSLANGGPYLSGFGALSSLGELFFGSPLLRETSGGTGATLNAFKTVLGTASAITGQSPWATYSSQLPSKLEGIEAGATYDGYVDTRNTNETPDWYRTNYPYRTAHEFKDSYYLGLVGSLYFYGALDTVVDYPDASGGEVKQRFVFGNGPYAGRAFQRVSATGTTWGSWCEEFNERRKPAFGSDLLETAFGTIASLTNFKTPLGTAAGIAGQGALATQGSVLFGSQISNLPLGISPGAFFPSGYQRADVIYHTGGSKNLDTYFPATIGSDKTGDATAAAISGQGPGATAPGFRVLNNREEGSVLKIAQPVGGSFYQGGSNQPGSIRIVLPGPTETMIRFVVDVFEYGSNRQQTYEIGGYLYVSGSQWYNVSARMIGGSDAARPVYFCRSSTGKYEIWIGSPSGVWQYPSVTIRDVQLSYGAHPEATWETGWSVALDATGAFAVDVTVSDPTAGDAIFGVNTREGPAGAVATNANYKTGLGTAAALAGQGALATLNNVSFASQITGLPISIVPGNFYSDGYQSMYYMRYNSGHNADALRPAEGLANITENRTAAAISGQGPGATATGPQVLNSVVDNNVLHVRRPIGGSYQGPSSAAGAISIQLPVAVKSLHSMVRFVVDVYELVGDRTQTYEVGGYLYATGGPGGGPTWYAVSARMIGGSGAARPVRFIRDSGGHFYVALGDPSAVWEYPGVTVRDVQVSYAGQVASLWETGWAVYLLGSLASYEDFRIANPNAGDAMFGVNTLESPAGSIATLPNFKTAQGTAAGIAGQGSLATRSTVEDGYLAGSLANRLAPHPLNASYLSAGTIAYPGGAGLDALQPAEAGANVTATHTAAAIAGQTSWATYGGLAPGNVAGQVQYMSTAGYLESFSRVTDRRITQTTRADGSTTVTESLVVTEQGIAAAIASQGVLATLNTVDTAQIAANAVTQSWYAETSSNAALAAATKTTAVSVPGIVKKNTGVLQVLGRLSLFSNDQIEVTIWVEIYSGGVVVAQRSATVELDGNDTTRMLFPLGEFFSGLAPGTYEARISVQRWSSHACSFDGFMNANVTEYRA